MPVTRGLRWRGLWRGVERSVINSGARPLFLFKKLADSAAPHHWVQSGLDGFVHALWERFAEAMVGLRCGRLTHFQSLFAPWYWN